MGAPGSRSAHVLAWWMWGAGAAVAISRVGNPLVLGLLAAAVIAVGFLRRGASQWAPALEASLVLGGLVVCVRVGFYILVGLPDSTPVVLDLPGFPLPAWFTNITLLGPVHTGGLVQASIEGLRLGALIVVFGAVSALANPRRALRHLPGSLHHLGTSAVIAVSAAPGLLSSAARIRRAQRLRGGASPRGVLGRLRGLAAVVVPVLAGALDQALALAGSMDSRGYARAQRSSRLVGLMLIVALFAAAGGTYGLLDSRAPAGLGAGLLLGGGALAGAASRMASAAVRRTRYRPQPWRPADVFIAGCGLVIGALALVGPSVTGGLGPWRASAPVPQLPALGAVMVALAALAMLGAPRPPRPATAAPDAGSDSGGPVIPGAARAQRAPERTVT